MRRLAGTKGGGYTVYEAEGSHRGMMAVRGLAKSAYGLNFVGNQFLGWADEDDPFHLEAYWLWMDGSDYRQVFLFHDGVPVAHDMMSCRSLSARQSWDWFAEEDGKGELWNVRNATCKLDRLLNKRSIRKDCHDYIVLGDEGEFEAAVTRGNDYERIAAAYALERFGPDRPDLYAALACDRHWKVRAVTAQCDRLPGHLLGALSHDPDWRVRRGCCLSCSAVQPWMSNDMADARWDAVTRLLADDDMEVAIAAVEVVMHALPGPMRNAAIERLDTVRDDDLKATAMVAVLSETHDSRI